MPDRVLNSWKDIATFLGRGVRTVQRWERELGLPVRRPRRHAKSPVIALASELQAWMAASPCQNHSRPGGAPLMQPTLPVVAVVDDDEIHRYALARSVARRGFSVLEADSGEAALRLFANIRPDVALIDVRLPGMDGFEVCRRLKRYANFSDTAILIHTAYDDAESRELARRVGASAFFTYPLNMDDLLGVVSQYAGRNSSSTGIAA